MDDDECIVPNQQLMNPFYFFGLKKDLDDNCKLSYDVMLKINQSKKILMKLLHEARGERDYDRDRGNKLKKNKTTFRNRTTKLPLLFNSNSISRNNQLKQLAFININAETEIDKDNKDKVINKEDDKLRRKREKNLPKMVPPAFLTIPCESYTTPVKSSKRVNRQFKSVIPSNIKLRPQLNKKNSIQMPNANNQPFHCESLSDTNIHSITQAYSQNKEKLFKKLYDKCQYNLNEAQSFNFKLNKYFLVHNSQSKLTNGQFETFKKEEKIITSLMDEKIKTPIHDHKNSKTIDQYASLSDRSVFKYRKNFVSDIKHLIHDNENDFIKLIQKHHIIKKQNTSKELLIHQNRRYIDKTLNEINYMMEKYKKDAKEKQEGVISYFI